MAVFPYLEPCNDPSAGQIRGRSRWDCCPWCLALHTEDNGDRTNSSVRLAWLRGVLKEVAAGLTPVGAGLQGR